MREPLRGAERDSHQDMATSLVIFFRRATVAAAHAVEQPFADETVLEMALAHSGQRGELPRGRGAIGGGEAADRCVDQFDVAARHQIGSPILAAGNLAPALQHPETAASLVHRELIEHHAAHREQIDFGIAVQRNTEHRAGRQPIVGFSSCRARTTDTIFIGIIFMRGSSGEVDIVQTQRTSLQIPRR